MREKLLVILRKLRYNKGSLYRRGLRPQERTENEV